jgi:hypothetical protein
MPKTIRPVLEISRLRLIGTEIRDLRETDFPHLLSKFVGFEKGLLWFTASLRCRQYHGKHVLCLFID